MSQQEMEAALKETEGPTPRFNEMAQKYLTDLQEESTRLGENYPLLSALAEEAIERVHATGRLPGREFYADVFKQKPLKVTQKVYVPVKQYPKFNFTGKLLGPKGNTLRRLQDETQCKIMIKGRGSVRDPTKEDEMLNSSDPRFSHLNKDLFIEISTVNTPAESHARIAYALAEIRKYLIPDKNDDISHDQHRELMAIDPKLAKHFADSPQFTKKSVYERKIGESSGPAKYLNLIKHTSHRHEEYEPNEAEPEEEYEYDYEPRLIKRISPPAGYAYRERPVVSEPPSYKRPPASAYDSETKRVREAPIRSYKPGPYSVLNKYAKKQ